MKRLVLISLYLFIPFSYSQSDCYNGIENISQTVQGYFPNGIGLPVNFVDENNLIVDYNDNANIIAIGAPTLGYEYIPNGIVRVYSYSTGQWTLIGDDIFVDQYFSQYGFIYEVSDTLNGLNLSSVQSSGLTGSFGKDISLNSEGNVICILGTYDGAKVYELIDNSWEQLGQKIGGYIAGNNGWESGEDISNVSLSSDGYNVAISGYDPENSDCISGSLGTIKVYNYNNNEWTQVGNTVLGESCFGQLGVGNLHISDNENLLVATESHNYDGGYNQEIAIKVYENLGSNWVQKGQTIVRDNQTTVSLSSDASTIATICTNCTIGNVKVYQYINDGWYLKGQSINTFNLNGNSNISINGDGSVISFMENNELLSTYNFIDNSWEKIFDIDVEINSNYTKNFISLNDDATLLATDMGSVYSIQSSCDEDESSELSNYIYGDVNCDGEVNSQDAALILQFIIGLIDTLPYGDICD